ncbi:hypothetical protein VF14_21780 [Nostoc linckia z18]|uniref:Uncharacterized protein n=2 Tax=Nostoc linckia TaxID=92942 RepID=A0A9Q5ZA98_NOSLI|nr:hypothetical protein [Nostoc linckia]PHK40474.1 hypothetical protein VF12_10235 [Nostoc linckia z15]PHK44365.1 hypothetical protein VF13_22090 [Nostoc linckia z16]PHJ57166.1 hypothetical protein VF02_31005 [Nostoc linckia z1]PHJ59642.1 hypothetical protein VF05_31760 [Nostoc linckia z3]PHJ63942.1 hypothetical protein VF03_29610 [Nostoc linckia z2]
MTIIWGNYEFEGPWSLNTWNPPRLAGIYAIMCKPYPLTQLNKYQIIYFGETENFAERGFPWNHHASQCWINQAGNSLNVYVGVCHLPGSTKAQRLLVESDLTQRYRPACNLTA